MNTDIKAVVAELERMERAAKPGPWVYSRCEKHPEPNSANCLTYRDRNLERVFNDRQGDPNGQFLMAIRNAAPAILAELRALRAVRDAAERYREEWHNYECMPVSEVDAKGIEASEELEDHARMALFAALDAARGEA